MSKLARVLVIGTMLATNLAGAAAVAQAHATDQPASTQDVLQPPTERQVGELYRHHQVASRQHTVASDTRRPPTERQVGESYRHQLSVPVAPAEPSGQPGWLIASLGVLAAALALTGLAVLAVKRTSRRARAGQAA
jgi:hypothetical protein